MQEKAKNKRVQTID